MRLFEVRPDRGSGANQLTGDLPLKAFSHGQLAAESDDSARKAKGPLPQVMGWHARVAFMNRARRRYLTCSIQYIVGFPCNLAGSTSQFSILNFQFSYFSCPIPCFT